MGVSAVGNGIGVMEGGHGHTWIIGSEFCCGVHDGLLWCRVHPWLTSSGLNSGIRSGNHYLARGAVQTVWL